MERSEMGFEEVLAIVIEIAESPRRFAAVTVTRESTMPLLLDEAAKAGAAGVSATPQQAARNHARASDLLTREYYQS